MGKYMRKAKISADVAVMDVSQPTLGVRTRARTLALQRLQSSSPTGGAPPSSGGDSDSSEYLQLRSRRLEKPSSLKQRGEKSSCRNGYPQRKSETKANPSLENSGSITRTRKEAGCCGSSRLVGGTGPEHDSAAEGSFGENTPKESRGTRESTPCSFIRDVDVAAPGSSTKSREANAGNQTNHTANPLRTPSQAELDEFFARENQQEQQRFMEKYNFDIINDVPLPGRYEWERVIP